jgi:hypothetical protein
MCCSIYVGLDEIYIFDRQREFILGSKLKGKFEKKIEC